MDKTILFAVDQHTEQTIVSSSQKGSNKVDFIERIGRQDNEALYHAVVTLTSITKAANFDVKIFKAMDKVCQMLYLQHQGV